MSEAPAVPNRIKRLIVESLHLEGMKPEMIEDEAPLFGEGLGLDSVDALEQWGFPATLTTPLKEIDDYRTMDGALLRAAFEVASRLTTEDYEEVPISRITCGKLVEDDLVPVMDQVRADADELRRAMLGDSLVDDDDWII